MARSSHYGQPYQLHRHHYLTVAYDLERRVLLGVGEDWCTSTGWGRDVCAAVGAAKPAGGCIAGRGGRGVGGTCPCGGGS